MNRDATLVVRIPSDLKESLRRAAEDDHGRSLSGMAVRILRERLLADGYYVEPRRPKKGR